MEVEYVYCKKCGTKMGNVRIDSPNKNISHYTCPHCHQRHEVEYGKGRVTVRTE